MASARDEAILRHIGLYRVTLRAVLGEVFFSGGNPANVIQRLVDEKLIVPRPGLPGGVSYYQLTRDGARHRVPLARADTFKPRALLVHLAILWFCCMETPRRVRLEDEHLERLFGAARPKAPQKPHCLEEGEGRKRLLRLYVPGRRSTNSSVLKLIRAGLEEVGRRRELSEWQRSRSYGFAILVDMEERKQALIRKIRETGILSEAFVSVHRVPSPETILEALHERRTT